MALKMNFQNLQQENSTLLMTRIMDNMAEEMKMTQLLSLGQKLLKQFFCDYSDAYILMTGDIAAVEVIKILQLNLKIVLLLQYL